MKRSFFSLFLLLLPVAASAKDDAALINRLPPRNIGPANMGGRIVDVDVVESDPRIIYVAAATGGLWKTVDAGTTWRPVFDGQSTQCLGDVTVAPSNPDVVWVGTGEANARNSVSWGDGVYRSTDGGKTWKHLGLKETHHIGRIAVHPRDPDTAYVAALGRVWGPNKERGLFKTTDGGKTWTHCLALDANTGCVDVVLDPVRPNVVYTAAYCVRRDAFSGGNPATQFGPRAGLYRSDDGGKTWTKLTNGLPKSLVGRCGLSVYRKDPRIVYAVVQTERTPQANRAAPPRADADPETGGVFRSDDGGQTWRKLNTLCPRPFYYGKIRVDPTDDQRVYVLGVSFYTSSDGGRTFAAARSSIHPDHHALWINPADPDHLVLGNDGGLYVSKSRGRSWTADRGLCISQFYAVAVDMRRPYRVYGGLQDNGSWGGASATPRADGVTLADWYRVAGADGFYCAVDPTDHNTVYAEGQYGRLQRVDLSNLGKGGKGGRARNRPIRPGGQKSAYRFNWSSPLLLSPHDSKTLYYGANVLFKSTNRGDRWEAISPDLTRARAGARSTGNTLSTIAESPVKAGLLYVGTDDGRLHISRNDGKTWTDLSDRLPGLPATRWITRVECSHFAEGTAYVTVGRHRNDDRRPYLFRTDDHGKTWRSLSAGLPQDAPLHVVRESSRNRSLLCVGTELGLYLSLDAGRSWHRHAGLPTVPVHDLVIHPRDRDLVVGTHGRGIYILDLEPLERIDTKVRGHKAHLFEPRPALAQPTRKADGGKARGYAGANPANGATVWYHLAETGDATLTVADEAGKVVARLSGKGLAGLNHVVWDWTAGPPRPGAYVLTLTAGGLSLTRRLRVEAPAP